ncbi:uncharacterized protein PAC_10054 [Phialocephala subalpina]|uniref:2EXR domain-containing protein n=1 Tax=Phialocephala subalpina TaxID=576137 RepID=A0A1L7X572_9HELO|nr:uncharacterized protein PAC_10054 [Phialocephala subalpina]
MRQSTILDFFENDPQYSTSSDDDADSDLAASDRIDSDEVDSDEVDSDEVESEDEADSDEADSDGAAKMFTPFPRLPIELRLKVWKYACFKPRLIDLWFVPVADKRDSFKFDEFQQPFIYESHCRQAPAVLHTSQEARNVGLQHYSLEFGSKFEGQVIFPMSGFENFLMARGTIEVSMPPQIYVNWACDIICPMPALRSGSLDEHFREEVYDDISFWSNLWHNFPELRKIAVASHQWESAEIFFYEHDFEELILYKHPEVLKTLYTKNIDTQKPIRLEFSALGDAADYDSEKVLNAKRYLTTNVEDSQKHPEDAPNPNSPMFSEGWKCPIITPSVLKVSFPRVEAS